MLRRRLPRSTLALMFVLALALSTCSSGGGGEGSGGGGGGSGTGSKPTTLSAKAYVAGVCGSVTGWADVVKSSTNNYVTQAGSATTLSQGKDDLANYVDELIQETDAMVAKVEALKPPAVAKGAEIQTAVVAAFQKLQTSFQNLKPQVAEIPTDNAAAYKKAADKIGASLNAQLSGLGDPLSGLHNAELDAAAKADPNCQRASSL